jgi:hypothetical protein
VTDPTIRDLLYSSPYVVDKTSDVSGGVGKVFIETTGPAFPYPQQKSFEWVPQKTYSRAEMNPNISIVTLELQEFVDTLTPSPDNLPVADQKSWTGTLQSNKTYNRKMIATLRENARRMNSQRTH